MLFSFCYADQQILFGTKRLRFLKHVKNVLRIRFGRFLFHGDDDDDDDNHDDDDDDDIKGDSDEL